MIVFYAKHQNNYREFKTNFICLFETVFKNNPQIFIFHFINIIFWFTSTYIL